MGWLLDLFKEIPLSAVLRERLADAEKRQAETTAERDSFALKSSGLAAENGDLKARVSGLEADLDESRAQVQALTQLVQRQAQELDELRRAGQGGVSGAGLDDLERRILMRVGGQHRPTYEAALSGEMHCSYDELALKLGRLQMRGLVRVTSTGRFGRSFEVTQAGREALARALP